MEDIKQIIAKNLINLRKKHDLTQNQLASKINYSDNAISRWERGEVTPSIETLQQIAEIFGVPLRSLIEDNALRVAEMSDRKQLISKLAGILISVSLVWLAATVIFAVNAILFEIFFWQIFCWSVPLVSIVMIPFHKYWGGHIFKFTILSIFVWSLLSATYIQFYFINSWFWFIFIIGIPIQIALCIWAFIKPKPKKKRKTPLSFDENTQN